MNIILNAFLSVISEPDYSKGQLPLWGWGIIILLFFVAGYIYYTPDRRQAAEQEEKAKKVVLAIISKAKGSKGNGGEAQTRTRNPGTLYSILQEEDGARCHLIWAKCKLAESPPAVIIYRVFILNKSQRTWLYAVVKSFRDQKWVVRVQNADDQPESAKLDDRSSKLRPNAI